MRFTTTVQLAGKTATGFVVPPEVVEGLGAGRKPPVLVTVAGYTYRSSIAARGERFLIPLSAEHRAAAGVAAGDAVEVEVALDTEPRTVAVPPDLAAALDAGARRRFDALSYSARQRHVLPIDQAKTPETRRRRIDKVVADLAA